MLVKDKTECTGKIKVIVRHDDGREEVHEFDNLVTSAGANLHRDSLYTPTDCIIRYIALGADNTAPAIGDTQLGDERFRTPVTIQTPGGAGVLTTVAYIQASEANDFTIEEIGWFAGPTATASADSGVLYARALYNRAKVSSESLQIEREGTIGGV